MKRSSLRALSEEQLGRFQTLQKGNDCTLHAISAALSILCDYTVSPGKLISEANQLWWRGRFFRLAPGWAVTPRMQARFVNYLARTRKLPISARLLHTSPEILRNLPNDDSLAALVTVYWLWGSAPALYYRDKPKNYNATRQPGGHTMLFASFDPEHLLENGVMAPWGFINSWVNGGSGLFWMEDGNFRKAWNLPLLGLGRNATVLISKTNGNLQPS